MKTIEIFESKEAAYEAAKKFAEEDAKANYLTGEVTIACDDEDSTVYIMDNNSPEAILSQYKVREITKDGKSSSIGFIVLYSGEEAAAFIFSEEIGVWL